MTLTTNRPTVAPERVTPLKPSEAIRLGRLVAPIGAHGTLFIQGDRDLAACALGAMALGYGYTPEDLRGSVVFWPDGFEQTPIPSLCQCSEVWGDVRVFPAQVISHTNDYHIAGLREPRLTEEQLVEHLAKHGL